MDWKNKNNSYAVVDVGGTNVRFAIFDENGKIISKVKTSTDYSSMKILVIESKKEF
ncbi:hypothetical protein [Mycoplasmopsis cynos]|uniref:hypothetical protein n=1 Tax=Mycoplasmopsis cynos TaxID=171284 RepID=UPI0024C7658D|nr:hypothetical protein [Mycoplasmopsis cynos]WAM07280.1 hypothetical protein ONA21_03545 [Mycoplasmopsis cynos]